MRTEGTEQEQASDGEPQVGGHVGDAVLALARGLVDTAREPVLLLDGDLRIVSANTAFLSTFAPAEAQCVGQYLCEFRGGEWDIPALRASLEDVLKGGGPLVDLEVEQITDSGAHRRLLVNASKIPAVAGEHGLALLCAKDVTGRNEAERPGLRSSFVGAIESEGAAGALLDGGRFLEQVFDSMQDGISVLDRDLSIIRANAALEQMYAAEMPILGKKCYAVYQQRDSQCPWCPSVPAMQIGKACGATAPYSSGEARDGWVELTSFPLRNGNGDIVGVIEHVKDITERRRAEQALRESEEQARLVVEHANEAIVVAQDGMLEYYNPRVSEITGYSPEELRTKPFAELLHPDDLARALVHHRQRLEGGEPPRVYAVRTIAKDGRVVWVDVSGVRITWNNRPATLNFMTDISERKRAEEVQSVVLNISQAVSDSSGLEGFLTTVHEQLGGLIDTTNLYVALYDEDDDTYTFPYHVDQYDDADDHTPVELRRSLTDYVRRTGKAMLVDEAEHQRLIREGVVKLVGTPSRIWLGVPLKAEREVIGVVTVQSYEEESLYTTQDLELLAFVSENLALAIERKRTDEERRKLEAQVQHAQKLESLGVLAGGIAHDFNNLLTGILGHADLILRRMPPESPAFPRVREIRATSERAADLCRQMLAYSGKGSFVIGPISLNDVIREMGQLLDASCSKKAALEYALTEDLPAVVVDATQVRQVVMNLITNASEAIGDAPGVISLRTGVLECDAAYLCDTYLDDELPPGDYAYIEVADTGPGMDGATQQRIFDPFFTTKFTGRGLGLAAVLGIVRGHKGAMKVVSEMGRGTAFRVLFPVQKESAERCGEPRARQRTAHGSGVVLLVDDEETVRNVGKLILEEGGYSVMAAADGREAVDVFRQHADEIAAVLLDLTMPNMGGEETLRELRCIKDDVRVVVSSGYSEQEVADRFAGEGLAGFIQKPYLVDDLIEKIRNAAEGT